MKSIHATLDVPPDVTTEKLSETLNTIGVVLAIKVSTVAQEVDQRLEGFVQVIVGAIVAKLAPFLSPDSVLSAFAPAVPRLASDLSTQVVANLLPHLRASQPTMGMQMVPTGAPRHALTQQPPGHVQSIPTPPQPPSQPTNPLQMVPPDVAAALLAMASGQHPNTTPQFPPEVMAVLAAMTGGGRAPALPNAGAPNGRIGPPNVFGWDAHGNPWDKAWGPAPVPNTHYQP